MEMTKSNTTPKRVKNYVFPYIYMHKCTPFLHLNKYQKNIY